jgi:hypothetical protein
MNSHPELIDPPWFQELIRKAFDRERYRLQSSGCDMDEAVEMAMWYIFDIRHNLTDLYKAAQGE